MIELLYEIEINGTWYPVGHELFRAWEGHRKLNGQIYYGPVFKFLSDNQIVTSREVYENYLRETNES